MDFLPEQEINDLLVELGVQLRPEGDTSIFMEIDCDHTAAKHCLYIGENLCGGDSDTRCFEMNTETLVTSIVAAVHKIHEGRTLMIPVGKWRSVFDVVAFSMAIDESWQEFDASATIKLNTRDPLLFESGDEQTLVELIKSLMTYGESQEQGVFLIPVGAPLLIHIQPDGPVKFWFGNSVLADEVLEVYTN